MRNFIVRVFLLLVLAGATSACQTTSGSGPVYLIRIEKGDTLAGIARKYDTTWEKISDLNGLGQATPKVGEILRVIPGPGGLVAGARPAPASVLPRLARRLPPRTKADLNGDGGDLGFTEDDIPTDDGKARRGTLKAPAVAPKAAPAPKAKGLFFDSGDAASVNDSAAFFRWPVKGEVSSPFGWRGRRHHEGIDIRARYGTNLVASGPGIVEFAGNKNGYGRTLIIRHGRWRTLYGHLSSCNVNVGDHVTRTSVIGQIGTTGNASGPHVHFEIRDPNGLPRDPNDLVGSDDLLSSN